MQTNYYFNRKIENKQDKKKNETIRKSIVSEKNVLQNQIISLKKELKVFWVTCT